MDTEELKARERVVYDPTQDCKLVGAARALGGVKEAVTIVHGRPLWRIASTSTRLKSE